MYFFYRALTYTGFLHTTLLRHIFLGMLEFLYEISLFLFLVTLILAP